VPNVARSAPADEQLDADAEHWQDSIQSYTSICRLELGRSPGSDLLLLLVSQVACNLGLCSSGPIAYGVMLKEVVDEELADGSREYQL